jgi:VanZ family protein
VIERRSLWIWIALALSGCSALMETLQNWVPNRVPDILDFGANSAGALCGAATAGLVRYFLNRSRS